jgi:hypothetical protein
MRSTEVLLSALLLTIAGASLAVGTTADARTLLSELRRGLNSVRELPEGTMPHPPKMDLSKLIGVSRADIQRAIGAPSYCDNGNTDLPLAPSCNDTTTWRYPWFPASRPRYSGWDPAVVIVGSGWLLVFTFSSNQVSAVHWIGQG